MGTEGTRGDLNATREPATLGATRDGAEDLGATRDGVAVSRDPGATRDGVAVSREVRATQGGAGVGIEMSRENLEETRDAPGHVSFGGGPRGATGPGGSELSATTDSLPRGPSASVVDVPERLGRYLVVGRIGAGGMGVVYKAYDPDLDRKVALKLLRGQGTEHSRTRLLREAQAMAKLSHPGVVPVFDVGTVEGQVFVAMDFIAGETLQSWMSPVKPWREVVELLVQAGLGLAAAHAAGLVHRDFKPETWSPSRTAPLPPSGRILANGGALRGDQCRGVPRHAATLATNWQRAARSRQRLMVERRRHGARWHARHVRHLGEHGCSPDRAAGADRGRSAT